MSEWKTLRVIVELPVRGDFGEKDLRWAVERMVGDAKLHHEINRFRGPLRPVDTGRALVKGFVKVMASNKPRVER